jgi:hypothetical protein
MANMLNVPTARGRVPFVARRLTVPIDVKARTGWIGDEGEAIFATLTGDLYAVNPRGDLTSIDRIPGETVSAAERRVTSLIARSPTEVLALTASNAVLIQNSLARRAQLPTQFNGALCAAVAGGASVWGTSTGVYLSTGAMLLQLNDARGPVTTADAIAPVETAPGAVEFWLKTGPNVRRVRYVDGAAPTFTEMPVNLPLGAVYHLASMGDDRAVISTERGLFVLRGNEATGFVSSVRGEPGAVAGGGGKAWVIWDTDVLRTDGNVWEALARDPRFGANSKISVDRSGNSALVIDDDGAVVRIDVEERLRLSGFRDNETIITPTAGLEVVPWRVATEPSEVSWFVDNEMMPTVSRMMAPWGWGYSVDVNAMGMAIVNPTGVRTRELATQLPMQRTGPYGMHSVRVVVKHGMESIERSVSFQYVSPFGRVPTYMTDIAPLYAARCARCHQNSVAEELSTFELLRNKRGTLRLALRERRMPPDLPLDSVSEALFLAWIDGNFPQ